jgi:hypothetical protein
MTKHPREPFETLSSLLGYVIAIAGIAMLVHAFFPEIHLWP